MYQLFFGFSEILLYSLLSSTVDTDSEGLKFKHLPDGGAKLNICSPPINAKLKLLG